MHAGLATLLAIAVVTTGSAAAEPLSTQADYLLCPVCEDVVLDVMTQLPGNTTEQDIIDALDKVCGHLPSQYAAKCRTEVPTLVKGVGGSCNSTLSKYPPRALCAALGQCSVECCQMYNQPEQLHISLTEDSKAVAVSWTTLNGDCDSIVQYDTVPGRFGLNVTGTSTTYTSGGWRGYVHTAYLTDLEPATVYFYRVGDPAEQTLWRGRSWSVPNTSFRSPGNHTRVTVGVVGDMGATDVSDPSVHRLKSMHLAGNLDAVLHVGDISYADGYQGLWDEFMRKIEPLAAHVPYMTCPGNHEAFMDFVPYKTRFNLLPKPGSSDVADADSMFYSFDLGPLHVISLNTEGPLGSITGTLNPGHSQLDWLERDLARIRNRTADQAQPWIVVMGHRPMLCSSNKQHYCTSDASYVGAYTRPLFDKYGVDLYLSGHAHLYERSFPTTVTGTISNPISSSEPNVFAAATAPAYIVNGASGTKEQLMDGFVTPQPAFSAMRVAAYGFGVITATADELSWSYISDDNSTALDTFTLRR